MIDLISNGVTPDWFAKWARGIRAFQPVLLTSLRSVKWWIALVLLLSFAYYLGPTRMYVKDTFFQNYQFIIANSQAARSGKLDEPGFLNKWQERYKDIIVLENSTIDALHANEIRAITNEYGLIITLIYTDSSSSGPPVNSSRSNPTKLNFSYFKKSVQRYFQYFSDNLTVPEAMLGQDVEKLKSLMPLSDNLQWRSGVADNTQAKPTGWWKYPLALTGCIFLVSLIHRATRVRGKEIVLRKKQPYIGYLPPLQQHLVEGRSRSNVEMLTKELILSQAIVNQSSYNKGYIRKAFSLANFIVRKHPVSRGQGTIIAVTSYNHAMGKSVLSVVLSHCLSIVTKTRHPSILLVETDGVKCSQSSIHGLEIPKHQEPSLQTWLLSPDNENFERAVTRYDEYDLVRSGLSTANSYLNLEKNDSKFDYLRSRYAYIIIDTIPINLARSPNQLYQNCDSVLALIPIFLLHDYIDRDLENFIDDLTDVDVEVLGYLESPRYLGKPSNILRDSFEDANQDWYLDTEYMDIHRNSDQEAYDIITPRMGELTPTWTKKDSERPI